ncbi:MAG: AAA family ATPase [Synergistaceae bacterium]|nr:AAA family ATPase [Synergistaceae bacterium]
MKVVSIINYKGGVGKTTLTANLGAYAALHGLRVLLIDLDPQTHLTFSFMTQEQWRIKYEKKKTLKNYFDSLIDEHGENSLASLVIPLNYIFCMKLDIISSHLELADMDMKLAGKCTASNTSQLASNSLRMYNYLRSGLKELNDEYDLVLIDCAPNFNALVRNAIIASDYYLVPARLDYLSSLGIDNLQDNVKKFFAEYEVFLKYRPDLGYEPASINMLGVVPMMVEVLRDKVIKAHQEYEDKMKKLKYRIFPHVMYNSKVFTPDRITEGPVVLEAMKHSAKKQAKGSALYKVIVDFEALGNEFLANLGLG